MNKEELDILEELINEEIAHYFASGYNIDDEYVIRLRKILKHLNLREIYTFDTWKHKEVNNG